FSLRGSTKHLRSQLAQCRQCYQDLQEKLLISEATVFAQANQLEKYRAIFSKYWKLTITVSLVSQLEAQLPKTGIEGKLAEELRSASWPGKYDSLIQDQARELSYLRQKIREGRGICYLLTQHAKDTVKSFEDLLRSNDIDYYLGQSFREQLAQGSQLTERLTSKLSTSKLSRELQEKEKVIEVLQAKLDARSLSPPSSHALSDFHRSPSSTSFLSDELEACSDMDIASEYTHCEGKKASPGHSGSLYFLRGALLFRLSRDLGNQAL
uniref:Olduvai domain-containing protein n=1 Tax=Spermophilus dauricus TaxID=99837 RepID=A0A8C9Q770_SPEDA